MIGCIKSITAIKIWNYNLAILDGGNNCVSFFTLDAQFIKNWQTMGHEIGRFWKPEKIAVDNPGNIYVADTGNNRIQVFDRRWELKMVIGSEGTGPGQFKNPEAVAVDDEQNIYVVDQGNYRIQKFNKKGEFLTMWGSFGAGDTQFEDIIDIDVDKDGYIYTLESDFKKVKKFTRDGQFLLKFYMTQPYNPAWGDIRGFAISNDGFIYAVGDHYINIFDMQGNFVNCYSKYDQLTFATDIEIGPSGDLFISDAVYGLAYFDKNLNFKEYIWNGQDIIKDFPWGGSGITVHPSGRVYVCAGGDGRIIVYEPKPGLALSIPASASAKGANNTYWRTDLSIFNPSEQSIDLKLNYFSIFGNKEIYLSLGAYEIKIFKDIVSNTFGMPESFGAITSICFQETQPILFSRTYTEAVAGSAVGAELAQPDLKGTYGKFVGAELAQPDLKGTYGQGIRALNISKFSNSEGYLIDLEENENFRTNFGLLPLSVSVFRDVFVGAEFIQPDIEGIQMPLDQNKSLVKFKLDLIKDGQAVDEKEIEAEEENLLQINNILSTLFNKNGSNFVLKIVPEEGAIYTAYISKVDNITGDAIFQILNNGIK